MLAGLWIVAVSGRFFDSSRRRSISCNNSVSFICDGHLMVRSNVTCGVSSRYGEGGSVRRIASTACVVLGPSVKHIAYRKFRGQAGLIHVDIVANKKDALDSILVSCTSFKKKVQNLCITALPSLQCLYYNTDYLDNSTMTLFLSMRTSLFIDLV